MNMKALACLYYINIIMSCNRFNIEKFRDFTLKLDALKDIKKSLLLKNCSVY